MRHSIWNISSLISFKWNPNQLAIVLNQKFTYVALLNFFQWMNLFMIFFLLISEFYTNYMYLNVFYLILSEIILKIYKQIIKIRAQTLFKSTFSLIRVKMSPTIPFYSPPTLTSLFFLLTNSILSCSAVCGSEYGAQWSWSFSEVAFVF